MSLQSKPDPRCRHVEHHDLVVGLSNALSKPHAFSRTPLIFVRFCQVAPLASRKVTPKPTPSESVPICLPRSFLRQPWPPLRGFRHDRAGTRGLVRRIGKFALTLSAYKEARTVHGCPNKASQAEPQSHATAGAFFRPSRCPEAHATGTSGQTQLARCGWVRVAARSSPRRLRYHVAARLARRGIAHDCEHVVKRCRPSSADTAAATSAWASAKRRWLLDFIRRALFAVAGLSTPSHYFLSLFFSIRYFCLFTPLILLTNAMTVGSRPGRSP